MTSDLVMMNVLSVLKSRTSTAGFAGVIIVEATKQVYAVNPGRRVRRWSGALRPALRPATATPRDASPRER